MRQSLAFERMLSMKGKPVLAVLVAIIFIISCSKTSTKPDTTPDINEGLIGSYPFNGNANDESGNEFHGTIDGPSLTTDRFDEAESAFYFDGNDDFIDLHDNYNFDFNLAFSICSWIKTNEIDGLRTILSKAENTRNSNNLYLLTIHFQYPRGVVRDTVGQDINVLASMPVTNNQWHFLCLTYDGSIEGNGLKIYVDGIFNSNGIKTGTPLSMGTSDGAAIGCEAVGFRSRNYFHGTIDDIRIYNRVLSDEEIKILNGQVE